MLNKTFTVLLCSAALTAASAQEAVTPAPTVTPSGIVKPTLAAPAVSGVSVQPAAKASASASDSVVPAAAVPTSVAQIVYTPQLPEVTALTNAATAQGLTVERLVRTQNQIIAFYRTSAGQTTTVAYQTLAPGAGAAPGAATVPARPAVVYQAAPRAIYYESPTAYYPRYDYPRYWYPPLSLHFGFGYRGGHYHRGHHWRRW